MVGPCARVDVLERLCLLKILSGFSELRSRSFLGNEGKPLCHHIYTMLSLAVPSIILAGSGRC